MVLPLLMLKVVDLSALWGEVFCLNPEVESLKRVWLKCLPSPGEDLAKCRQGIQSF